MRYVAERNIDVSIFEAYLELLAGQWNASTFSLLHSKGQALIRSVLAISWLVTVMKPSNGEGLLSSAFSSVSFSWNSHQSSADWKHSMFVPSFASQTALSLWRRPEVSSEEPGVGPEAPWHCPVWPKPEMSCALGSGVVPPCVCLRRWRDRHWYICEDHQRGREKRWLLPKVGYFRATQFSHMVRWLVNNVHAQVAARQNLKMSLS